MRDFHFRQNLIFLKYVNLLGQKFDFVGVYRIFWWNYEKSVVKFRKFSVIFMFDYLKIVFFLSLAGFMRL